MIKLSNQIPKIYLECHKRYGVKWNQGIVITYGDTVYSKFPISKDLEVHEATHIKQQLNYGVEKWWNDYFNDDAFRLSQEKEAYLNQSKYIKQYVKDKNDKFRLLNKITKDLSSSIYGNIISYDEAKKLLQ